MKKLAHDDYLALRAGAVVLEADGFGDKVLRLADGTMCKLFRRKRLLSSAAWYPYAQRFADNAATLAQRGIPVPGIIDVLRIPSIERDAVHYRPLVGWTLREMRRAGIAADVEQGLKVAFTRFVILLHEKGVYFRSLHLGNVVYTPDGRFGLIDISDARFRPQRLGKNLRQRNLRLLTGIADEADWIDAAAVINAWRAPPPPEIDQSTSEDWSAGAGRHV
ncbi:MAG: toluene tolerance protein [Candidatus Accumulibacter sp.]|uniref:toluene tolerance protein n=1 Tax=Accumulibacter sp. TaxID=2053492 RepID=UPI001A485919|nr:toluene tolerance protein [Accumulibacter sp.]MBL8396365.1 toluene tolerance protein [Accumulibacter sp.]